jgi:hypothetical protein
VLAAGALILLSTHRHPRPSVGPMTRLLVDCTSENTPSTQSRDQNTSTQQLDRRHLDLRLLPHRSRESDLQSVVTLTITRRGACGLQLGFSENPTARLGDRGCGCRAGNAKVGHLHSPCSAQEDVLRFYVTVDDAALVGRAECLGDLQRERGGNPKSRGPSDVMRSLSVPPGTYSIAM